MLLSARNFNRVRLFRGTVCGTEKGDIRTVQSDKDSADINVIMKRYARSGQLPQVTAPPSYLDFQDGVFDFQSAQNMLVRAREAFLALPWDVRKEFDHDPHKYVDFVEARDDKGQRKNLTKLRELGIVLPEAPVVPEKIQKVEVVNGAKPA